MNTSSSEFTLQFNGFEGSDPVALERFTVFCQANFSLSSEDVRSLASRSSSVVLTHGGTFDELDALAKALREIGARVDVACAPSSSLATSLVEQSNKEADRNLSTDRAKPDTLEAQALCSARRPRQRTYTRSRDWPFTVTSPSEMPDTRSLRLRTRLAKREEARNTEKPTLQYTPFTHPITKVLILFLLALGMSASWWYRDRGEWSGIKKGRVSPELLLNRPPLPSSEKNPPTKLGGRASQAGYTVEIKTVATERLVSISSIVATASEGTPRSEDAADTLRVTRIEGDPIFLSEESKGRWVGLVSLSLSVEAANDVVTLTRPAEIVVTLSDGATAGTASIKIAEAGAQRSGAQTDRLVLKPGESPGTYVVIESPTFTVPLG